MEYFVGPNLTTAIGLVFCVVGAFLVAGKLRPNQRLGLVTKRTMADASTWYRAHRAFGCVFFGLGMAIVLVSLLPAYPVHPALPLAGVIVSGSLFAWVYYRFAA